jgi:hypothetical protein
MRNSAKYKKENMETLFMLEDDHKGRRIFGIVLIILMALVAAYLITAMQINEEFKVVDAIYTLITLILFIILYLPTTKKTKITTLGIFRRTNLTRWEDIKGINYGKPNEKGIQKIKILYKTSYRDTDMDLTFKKDDAQIEQFKNAAKEYRNNKKKDKKIGK